MNQHGVNILLPSSCYRKQDKLQQIHVQVYILRLQRDTQGMHLFNMRSLLSVSNLCVNSLKYKTKPNINIFKFGPRPEFDYIRHTDIHDMK